MFNQFADFEDVAVLFFDCDNDNDQDLFIGSGGNNVQVGGRELQLRLYKNDGKGNFTADGKAFPENIYNTSVAVASDIDNDGDLDLFVGSRNVTRQYGLTPLSHMYLNDGSGHFSEMPKDKTGGLESLGMVTSAAFADINGNGYNELIIAGEWMYPRIFSYKKNHFEEQTTGFKDMYGWWQTLVATDVDNDGDIDLVLGNEGENLTLQPSEKKPVKLFIQDFDGNGTPDGILTHTVDERDMPVFMKREITDQIPSLKKQNLKNKDYATKSVQELFTPDIIKNALIKKFSYPSSVIAYNDGKGNFTIKKLPEAVQFSSVNAILMTDLNGDNFKDMVLGGNEFGFLPQFARLDGSFGHVLMNDGKGNFKEVPASRSGLELGGQIRDIRLIEGTNNNYIIVLQNNEKPVLYKINK